MRSLASILIIALTVTACAKAGGNEFVGKWTNIKYPAVVLEIERNGQSFMVRDTRPSFAIGKRETKNVPATYKDGQLHISTELGGFALAIDAATGNLTDGKHDYQKTPR